MLITEAERIPAGRYQPRMSSAVNLVAWGRRAGGRKRRVQGGGEVEHVGPAAMGRRSEAIIGLYLATMHSLAWGAAAHGARAARLIAGDDRDAGAEHIEHARWRA